MWPLAALSTWRAALTGALLLLTTYLPASQGQQQSTCPAHCACSRQTADCAGRGLTALPTSTTSYALTSLLMEGNSLAQLELTGLATSWPRLKSLDLSRNRIRFGQCFIML